MAQNQGLSRTFAPLSIAEQGSFAVGGKIIFTPGTFNPKKPTPSGQTFHGDPAYVFYQNPVRSTAPVARVPARGEAVSKTRETKPDGREGFKNIFLRRRASPST